MKRSSQTPCWPGTAWAWACTSNTRQVSAQAGPALCCLATCGRLHPCHGSWNCWNCGRYIRRKTCRKHRKVCLLSEMGDKRLKEAPLPWCLCREVLFPLNRPQQERLWEREQVQTLIKHLLPIIFPQFHLCLTLAPLQSCFLRQMAAA